MAKFIQKLHEKNELNLHLIGGKAYNLKKVVQLGWKIPEGFIVPVSAQKKFFENTGLSGEIERFYKVADPNNLKNLETLANPIRRQILKGTIPDDLHNDIFNALEQLGVGPWNDGIAIRSSAICEDQPGRSAAGCYTSVMLTDKKKDWQSGIKKCWVSGFKLPALCNSLSVLDSAYHPHLMGIIIQHRVPGEISGVCLTSHPNPTERGDNQMIIIEAISGSCEPIVSGKATPNRYFIDSISDKLIESIPGKSKINLLSENQVTALAKEFSKLHFQFVDNPNYYLQIEWTLAQESLIILQVREMIKKGLW